MKTYAEQARKLIEDQINSAYIDWALLTEELLKTAVAENARRAGSVVTLKKSKSSAENGKKHKGKNKSAKPLAFQI